MRHSLLRLTCGLCLSALLLNPAPAPAAPAACRLSANQSGMIGDIRTVISAEAARQPPVTLRLTFRMQTNGAARGSGEIRAAAEAAPAAATAPYTPVLIAVRQVIEAACADLDGDGKAGLTTLSLDVRDPASGDRIPIVLQSPGREISASGVYKTVLRVGTETFTSDVRVHLTRDRDRRHRR